MSRELESLDGALFAPLTAAEQRATLGGSDLEVCHTPHFCLIGLTYYRDVLINDYAIDC